MSGDRVLVTGGAYTGGLAALRGLRAAGYRPWATVARTWAYASFSRAPEGRIAVPDPEEAPPSFAAAVAAASAEHGIRAVLPGTEAALRALAAARDGFPPGVAVGAPEPEIVARATAKEHLRAVAAAAGVETPPTYVAEREAVASVDLPYPLVLKPLQSSVEAEPGRRRHAAVVRVESPAGLDAALARVPGDKVIAQPFLDGDLCAVCGVAWEGGVVVTVHQRAVRIWPPRTGVSSFAHAVAPDPELEAAAAGAMRELRWSGIFQLQFLDTGEARYLIDVNPRIYGSLALAIAAGANLPAIWTDLLLGREPRIGAYRRGARYRSEELDVRALVRCARTRGIADAVRAALPQPGTTHAVGSLRDPLPLVASVGRALGRQRARPARVLVTAGEHIGPLAALRALHDAGYATWSTAYGSASYAARSRAVEGVVVVPRSEGFAEEVCRAAQRNGIAAVLPGTERDLVALAEARDTFPEEVVVGTPPRDVVARATSKDELVARCAAAGIAVPPTRPLAAAGELQYPAVVKPLRSETRDAAGRIVHAAPSVVATEGELQEAVARFPGADALVQPFLSDRIYGVCGVAWKGELVCTEHQASERIWPVDAGMVSFVETVERDTELDARIARLVAGYEWSGIFQLQLLEHDGTLYAIDLNPRIYISLSLAVEAGMNLPAIWVDLLLGREPRVTDYRVGVRWRNEESDPRAILAHLVRGDRRRAARGLVPRSNTTHAVFSRRDPAPALHSVRKLVARARRD